MKRYSITVSGVTYDVTVEELSSAAAPVATPVAAPAAAPAGNRPAVRCVSSFQNPSRGARRCGEVSCKPLYFPFFT